MTQEKKKGISAWALLAIVCAVTLLGPLAFAGLTRMWALLFAVLYGLLFGAGSLLMRTAKKSVLRRRWLQDPHRPWDVRLRLPAVLLYPVISIVSAVDAYVTEGLSLPYWTWMVGGALLAAAYLTLVQTLMATPPHARDLYGEAPPRQGEHGAYELLRHPVEFSAILLGFSIALFLGSGVGLIIAALQTMLFTAYVAREDHWRFTELEWYYDYTQKTPKKLFLFIW